MTARELLDLDFATVPELIRSGAVEYPTRPVLISGNLTLTYAELDELMDRVAVSLQRDGLVAGETVAICAANSIGFVAVYLGALRAGVVAALLPTSNAPDSLARMLADSGARILFLDAAANLPAAAAAHPKRIAIAGSTVDEELETWLAPPGERPRPVRPDPSDLCNILYSSGTTGEPKGVMQSHAMRWIHAQQGGILDGPATMLISTPLHSTGGSVSLMMALGSLGSAVVMARFDPRGFLELAEARRVTHATLVPVQYRRILDDPEFDSHDLSSFKRTFMVAAPAPAALKVEILKRWPGGLTEIYGLTEGGACLLQADQRPDKLHTVGRAGPRTELRVIDDDGQEVPVGQTGEVVAHSPAMMSGYHNRPLDTAAAEWRDPSGKRFIRTGDVGRLDEEGFLTLVDRKKDMIISGGVNVYSSDLESVLLQHGQVAEAAVVGAPSSRWGETPVGFVAARAGASLTADEVLAWANARLGKTQRLAWVQLVQTLPRNALGKVLKRELREQISAPSRP